MGNKSSTSKELKIENTLLETINSFGKWLIEQQNNESGDKIIEKKISGLKDDLQTFVERLAELTEDVASQEALLKEKSQEIRLKTPKAEGIDKYLEAEKTDVELKANIKALITEQARILAQLNDQNQVKIIEFKIVIQQQLDILPKINALMDKAQENEVLLNLYAWNEEMEKFLQGEDKELDALLRLHALYGEIFPNCEHDENPHTREMFKTLETSIVMAFQNELLNPESADKLALLYKVIDNITPKTFGSVSLQKMLLPILQGMQKEILKSDFDKLKDHQKNKISTFLDPSHFAEQLSPQFQRRGAPVLYQSTKRKEREAIKEQKENISPNASPQQKRKK